MIYLGSKRVITQDYNTHKVAEDYSGNFKSDIKINGTGKVIKVINKFISHQDSINYNTFLANQNNWFQNGVYRCISITGKEVLMTNEETGGNQIWIETYEGNNKVILRLCHLDSVLVKTGDIVTKDMVIARQGNTGLVLSGKDVSDNTYGTHVHLEVTVNGINVNPRKFANGEVITTYFENDNKENKDNNQIKILVKQINIRENSDETSKDIGDVYYGEFYNVLDIIIKEKYTWYKIKTGNGIIGYVANKVSDKWIEYIPKIEEIIIDNDNLINIKHIFTCDKDGKYLLYLKKGEKVYIAV